MSAMFVLRAPGIVCRGAIALAVQKMLEEDLYFGIMYAYWQRDDSFEVVGPAAMSQVPALMRPVIMRLARAGMLKSLQGQVRGGDTCVSCDHPICIIMRASCAQMQRARVCK